MRCRAALALFAIVALGGGMAVADDANKSAQESAQDANFGSRTDKPDGSSALTVGHKFPTVWETKIGTDVKLGPQQSSLPSENFAYGTLTDQSTGSVWGSITMPGFQPLGFDKTALEARMDARPSPEKAHATYDGVRRILEHLGLGDDGAQ